MKRNDKEYLELKSATSPYHNNYSFWGPGVRDLFIIHYVLNGHGFFECGDRTYSLSTGQSFIIYPNTLVKYYPDDSDPWEYVWVDFSGSYADELIEYTAFSPETPITYMMGAELGELYKKAGREFKKETPADICRNTGNLHHILAYYMEYFPGKIKREYNQTLTRALDYIELNYRKPTLNVDKIANELNVSRVSLYRSFKNELNVSPNQYITEYRISKALEMLKKENLSVKHVAYSVGFSDQLYFSKVFKNQTGMPPSEYKATYNA